MSNTTTLPPTLDLLFADLLVQAKLHLPHVALAPFMLLGVVTLLHELAHAMMVWALGGTVTEFSIVPQAGSFGHISYVLPDPGDGFLVAAGPTLMWTAVMLLVLGLSLWRWPPAVGVGLFIWGYAVPFGDIVWHAIPYLAGERNDLLSALGPPDPLLELLWVGALLAASGLGVVAAWRLYGDKRPRLATLLAVVLVGGSVGGLAAAVLAGAAVSMAF